jgi:hypothetical protein
MSELSGAMLSETLGVSIDVVESSGKENKRRKKEKRNFRQYALNSYL